MNDELDFELLQLSAKGYCCSQIMLAKALQIREEENPALIEAAAGLCNGMQSGLVCGALSGACCALSLLAGDSAPELIMQLNEWFGREFGSFDCNSLTSCGNPEKKAEICPGLVAAVCGKMFALLEELDEY